jgi:hypothetical protein
LLGFLDLLACRRCPRRLLEPTLGRLVGRKWSAVKLVFTLLDELVRSSWQAKG